MTQTTFTVPGIPLTDKDTISTPGGGRLRCSWEVMAGLFPGHVIDEYTRRWIITSETWESENAMNDEQFKAAYPDGLSTFAKYKRAAHEYAQSIEDPRRVNTVTVQFFWA